MSNFLVTVFVIAVISIAASVKEWKNFENGKVYSHKKLEGKNAPLNFQDAEKRPVIKEHLLHNHHKKIYHHLKTNRIEAAKGKEYVRRNPERHHKKIFEEEMLLKPLHERHHKFKRPAVLKSITDFVTPSSQITMQTLENRGHTST